MSHHNSLDALLEVTCEFFDVGEKVDWDGMEDNYDFFSIKDLEDGLKAWTHPKEEEIERLKAEAKDAAFERGEKFTMDVFQELYLDLPEGYAHNSEVVKGFIAYKVRSVTSGSSESGYEFDVENVGTMDALGCYEGAQPYMITDALSMRAARIKYLKSIPLRSRDNDEVKSVNLLYLTSYWSDHCSYTGEWDAGIDIKGLVSLEDLQVGIHGHEFNREMNDRLFRIKKALYWFRSKWKYSWVPRSKLKLKKLKGKVWKL